MAHQESGPIFPFDFQSLERKAMEKMNPRGFGYVATGAGQEKTTDRNEAIFDNYQIVPRMLRNVRNRNLHTSILNHELSSPIMLAPIGVLDMAYTNGDLEVAEACRNTSTPFLFSNQASFSMEEMAGKMGDELYFFQLYWSRSDELVRRLYCASGSLWV